MTAETPRFWYLRRQALIHAKAGNKKTAIAAENCPYNWQKKRVTKLM